MLPKLTDFIPKERFGIYRDDFRCISDEPGPTIDKLKKNIISIFKEENLRMIPEGLPFHIVNFLYLTLNLKDNSY